MILFYILFYIFISIFIIYLLYKIINKDIYESFNSKYFEYNLNFDFNKVYIPTIKDTDKTDIQKSKITTKYNSSINPYYIANQDRGLFLTFDNNKLILKPFDNKNSYQSWILSRFHIHNQFINNKYNGWKIEDSDNTNYKKNRTINKNDLIYQHRIPYNKVNINLKHINGDNFISYKPNNRFKLEELKYKDYTLQLDNSYYDEKYKTETTSTPIYTTTMVSEVVDDYNRPIYHITPAHTIPAMRFIGERTVPETKTLIGYEKKTIQTEERIPVYENVTEYVTEYYNTEPTQKCQEGYWSDYETYSSGFCWTVPGERKSRVVPVTVKKQKFKTETTTTLLYRNFIKKKATIKFKADDMLEEKLNTHFFFTDKREMGFIYNGITKYINVNKDNKIIISDIPDISSRWYLITKKQINIYLESNIITKANPTFKKYIRDEL